MGTLLLFLGKAATGLATVLVPLLGIRHVETEVSVDDHPPAQEGAVAPGQWPVAAPAPGKPGFCINPYTGGHVDVRGIPAGFLVRDPKDPDPDHMFRVP